MSSSRFTRALFLILTSLFFLAACGGGGGGSDSSPGNPASTLSDAELKASVDAVASQTAYDVEREMGFPDEDTYACDAEALIGVQNEGERRFCIVLKDDAQHAAPPAVSPDGVDFYLELPPMSQSEFDEVLLQLESGQYDGNSLPFTPVLSERIERQVEIGSLVELTFEVAQAGYGSCDIHNDADEWVTSIDSLSKSGDQLSGTLPADLPTGTYRADCEFTNADGTFPAGSDQSEGVPAAATIEITSSSGNEPDLNTIYFDADSSVISLEGRDLLDEYTDYLTNNPDVGIRLEGHADENETDSREASITLGEDRANAAQDYLVLQGVDRTRIQSTSYGEEQPVAEGSSDSEKALNRRVEILLEQ